MVTLLTLCVSLEPVSLMTTETNESEDHRRRIFDRRRRIYTRSTPLHHRGLLPRLELLRRRRTAVDRGTPTPRSGRRLLLSV